ncbi:MAG: hypothetical protein C5B49_09010 [Bdellovibrio sp.]|nr:MAG: hypothetical protein C5B49_09010 [Bdellovibrio sp.]
MYAHNKGGQVMLMEIVLSQVQAWNSGNLDRLLPHYADTVQVYAMPDNTVIFDGKEKLKAHLKPEFDNGKVVQVKVLEKLEYPPYVVLVEEKSAPEGTRRAVVTYLIEDGKITKMWIAKVECKDAINK